MAAKFSGGVQREVAFVSAPGGIFLETGTWFAIKEDALRTYAKGVLKHFTLESLLADADVWLRSPRTYALTALPLLLLVFPVWLAAVLALAFYGTWYVIGPSLVNYPMLAITRYFDTVAFQAIYYVFVLSVIAGQGYMAAVWVGLAGFILFRWGIIERVMDRLLAPAVRSVYSLPLPDQVLRGVIIRRAIGLKVQLPQFGDMERSIRDRWQ
jgi:hypothetical protein